MANEYKPYVEQYNAKDCVVMVDGEYITGLGEDMISIEKEEALAENSVGAQGDIVRSVINNGIYNVTLTVQSKSPKIGTLWALSKTTEFFPISISNKSLGMSFEGTKAQFMELPEYSMGATAEDLEFTICVYDGQYTF